MLYKFKFEFPKQKSFILKAEIVYLFCWCYTDIQCYESSTRL